MYKNSFSESLAKSLWNLMLFILQIYVRLHRYTGNSLCLERFLVRRKTNDIYYY